MRKKELRVIYDAIFNARMVIENLASENYPWTDIEDADLRKMFRDLNKMAIKMHEKMEATDE